MERKFTDDEIVKALDICSKNNVTRHNELTYEGMPLRFLFEDALDLINRQKAEIDRLKSDLHDCVREVSKSHEIDKNKAIIEFAERLKNKASGIRVGGHEFVTVEGIDNLVKEMVGEKNGN